MFAGDWQGAAVCGEGCVRNRATHEVVQRSGTRIRTRIRVLVYRCRLVRAMADWREEYKGSKYVVCIGKEYVPGKHKFTGVGVGFETQDKKGIRIHIDLSLLLTPDTHLFVFLRGSHKEEK